MNQLIYGIKGATSTAPGGWGVLAESPGLAQSVSDALMELVPTKLQDTLPQYPTAQQILDRPVQWRVVPDHNVLSVCRSVEAGVDFSGRPGSIFSHAAQLPVASQMRVTDWFAADGWLAPFGAAAVAEAALSSSLTPVAGQGLSATLEHWAQSQELDVSGVQHTFLALVQAIYHTKTAILVGDAGTVLRWLTFAAALVDVQAVNSCAIALHEDPAKVADVLAARPTIISVATLADGFQAPGVPIIRFAADNQRENSTAVATEHKTAWFRFFDAFAEATPEHALELLHRRDALINTISATHRQSSSASASEQLTVWATEGALLLAEGEVLGTLRQQRIKTFLDSLPETVVSLDVFSPLAKEVGRSRALKIGVGGVKRTQAKSQPPQPKASPRQPITPDSPTLAQPNATSSPGVTPPAAARTAPAQQPAPPPPPTPHQVPNASAASTHQTLGQQPTQTIRSTAPRGAEHFRSTSPVTPATPVVPATPAPHHQTTPRAGGASARRIPATPTSAPPPSTYGPIEHCLLQENPYLDPSIFSLQLANDILAKKRIDPSRSRKLNHQQWFMKVSEHEHAKETGVRLALLHIVSQLPSPVLSTAIVSDVMAAWQAADVEDSGYGPLLLLQLRNEYENPTQQENAAFGTQPAWQQKFASHLQTQSPQELQWLANFFSACTTHDELYGNNKFYAFIANQPRGTWSLRIAGGGTVATAVHQLLTDPCALRTPTSYPEGTH